MAEPSSYRPAPGEIPTDPGVYRFRDADGRVIYVGKAKNLRNRLNSYFASPQTLSPKTYAMVHTAASVDADLFAYAEDDLEASVQVFFVRGGRIRGQRGWIVEKVNDSTDAQLIEQLIAQVYSDIAASLASQKDAEKSLNSYDIPRSVLVPVEPENKEQLASWLAEVRGGPVEISVPQRGDKAELMKTVAENARQSLTLHKSRRAGDLTTRSASLVELQEALELPDPLLRIECYDISHVQGTNVVASMVVFEDGMPAKNAYRTYSITGDAARDDTASMYDVITRRFKRHLAQQAGREAAPVHSGEIDASTPEPAKFAYPPNLVLVDGGPPQVAAASAALSDLGITDVYVAGIAKRLEELWLPDDDYPVVLPRTSQALYLVQRIRDEAHRFAITFHRSKRGKAMVASALDEVPGLGEVKRSALIKHFGSVAQMKQASAEELTAVPGIGPALAQKILAALT